MASFQTIFVKSALRRLRKKAEAYLHDLPRLRLAKEKTMGGLKGPKEVTMDYFRLNGLKACWFIPPNEAPNHVIYYLHGGGYAAGSIHTHHAMIGKIALETGIRVLAINYRLAPENPFPDGLNDAVNTYQWLIGEGGYLPLKVIISGDSAGGGLALATLLALKEQGVPQPLAAVCLSPWTDLAMTGESIRTKAKCDPILPAEELPRWAQRYAGAHDPHHPLISPLFGDLKGLPPILIQVGTDEIIMDDSTRFAERAKAAGVQVTLEVWDSMPHVFQICWQYLPEGRKAIRAIHTFIQARIIAAKTDKAPHEEFQSPILKKAFTVASHSLAVASIGTSIIKTFLK